MRSRTRLRGLVESNSPKAAVNDIRDGSRPPRRTNFRERDRDMTLFANKLN